MRLSVAVPATKRLSAARNDAGLDSNACGVARYGTTGPICDESTPMNDKPVILWLLACAVDMRAAYDAYVSHGGGAAPNRVG
jgi:hypothetical protein